MSEPGADRTILEQIQHFVAEEERLYRDGAASEDDRAKLEKINVALDRCWDLLRQRRALREYGKNPDEAALRPAGVVERYTG